MKLFEFKNTAKTLDANDAGIELVFNVNICFREFVLFEFIDDVNMVTNYSKQLNK